MKERAITAPDGVEVFHRVWAVDDGKAVVVIAHGASEHSGRYARFAAALNEAGYSAVALDHRGHGRTAEGSGVGRLGPGGAARLLDDLHDLVEKATSATGGLPVLLFGHSMGSMITQAYVETYGEGLAGYVLSGCPGPMEGIEEMRAGVKGAVDGGMGDEPVDLLSGFNAAFEPARTKFDWLSRDEEEVDKYVSDPLCGDDMPLTFGFVDALLGHSAPAMEPEGIAKVPKMPVLMITGEMDPASGMGANARELERRLREAGLDVTAHYYPEARHEVLNETNRDEVTADVVAWLDEVVGAAPPG
jgi:alpha-beta hydrolase superfamily lysophospholipase